MNHRIASKRELRQRIKELELENRAYQDRLEAVGRLIHEVGGDEALLRATVICMRIQPYGDLRLNGGGIPLPE